MAIDPDLTPLLDGLSARLAALEAAPAGTPADLLPVTVRVSALEDRLSAMAVALAATGASGPDGSPDPVTLPTGYRRAGDFRRARGDAADWAVDELIMTTWLGGAGTMGDPSLCQWESAGSVLLKHVDGTPPRSGVLQLNRPAPTTGPWGALLEVVDPGAVCAFFTYARTAREFDFELIKKDGQPVWAVGIHMPKAGGGTVSSEKVLVPLAAGVHRYEIAQDAGAVTFRIDGAQVARFTPADVPGATWEMETPMQILCSVEHHGAWRAGRRPTMRAVPRCASTRCAPDGSLPRPRSGSRQAQARKKATVMAAPTATMARRSGPVRRILRARCAPA
ncbi:glycoside hydrolase family 16 protein [Cereibacter sphaeroides]|uniref:glycoside hydrolase family 16 protein n=1 Tax=Cereibacter sphaeroides TaxID=1063 RepID=UPI001F1DA0A5|nr:glycoside hydrolase family 16 protein [Cereibacter sphaeroides]